MERNSKPRVAIITRTKDRPLLLRRAMKSVLGQRFEDWVHVIVNDGGDMHSVDLLLQEFAGDYRGRCHLVHHRESLGMQNASNSGIENSDSEFLCIHDDDDSWHPAYLETTVNALESAGSEYPACITQTVCIHERITGSDQVVEAFRYDFLPCESISLYDAAGQCPFPPIALLYRRELHEELGMFNQYFTVLGDWDFNLRILQKYEILVLEQKLAFYHWRIDDAGNINSNTVTRGLEEHRKQTVRLQNHYLRRDLQEGKFGIGYLLNAKQVENGQNAQLWTIRNSLPSIEKLVKRIADRLKRWEYFVTRNKNLKGQSQHRFACIPSRRNLPGKDPLSEVAGQLRANDVAVLSLDVFDTCLLRPLFQPVDVFALLERESSVLPDKKAMNFRQARIMSESAARRRKKQSEGSEEVTLQEIYEELRTTTGMDEDAANGLMQKELELEERMLLPNIKLREFLREHCRDLEIHYVTDMYLPARIIAERLKAAGFPEGRIFVSCEMGASKAEGDLYDRICRETGSEPEKTLHVGDNLHSDVRMGEAKGFKTCYIQTPFAVNTGWLDFLSSKTRTLDSDDLLARISIGTILTERWNRTEAPDFYEEFGFEIMGPVLLSFAAWLLQKSRELDLTNVWFLARDGYYVKEVFDRLCHHCGLNKESKYVFASRRLLNLAGIRKIDETALDFLCTPNPQLRVCDFLERLGLEACRFRHELNRAGFQNAERVITGHNGLFLTDDDRAGMRQFFLNMEGRILEKAKEERDVLCDYFNANGFLRHDGLIVDLGWQASLPRSFHSLRCSLSPGLERRSEVCMFGTWEHAERVIPDGCNLSSFFMHLGKPEYNRDTISCCVELIEFMFTAPHPTIIGMEKQGEHFQPLYGKEERSSTVLACAKAMADAALDFCGRVIERLPLNDVPHAKSDLPATLLSRLLREPTEEEARQFSSIMHRDGFGGSSIARPLITPPDKGWRTRNAKSLRAAYQHSYWKNGFLQLINEEQRCKL